MKKIVSYFLFFLFLPAYASEPIYHFLNKNQENRFHLITSEVRCLVCQNQNIAESNAPLASDLRQIIYQQIQKGESNEAIIQFLVNRYGSYILFKPPFNLSTVGLWLCPFIFLVSALSYLFYFLYRHRREYDTSVM